MPRAFINGEQWIEANPLRGSGIAPAAKIGSKTDVHNVLAWTPANNSDGNEIAGPITVNFEAVNTDVLDIDGATGTYFDDNGTHDDTVGTPTGIELATSAPFVDFEDYSGNLAGSNPDNWTRLDQKYDSNMTIQNDPVNSGEKSVRGQVYNSVLDYRLDDAGEMYGGVLQFRFLFPAIGDWKIRAIFQTQGAGSALRGYALQIPSNSTYAQTLRITDWDSTYGMHSRNHGVTIQANNWYWLKVHFWGTTTTYFEFKVWKDGDAEPASYIWGDGDSAYTQEGYVGFATVHNVASPYVFMDDFSIVPDPATYASSGEWISDPLDVSAVETLASSRIYFDVTTPANTTAALKCRWRNTDAWIACTDGAPLPGIEYRDDMTPGAAKSELELKVELATTDTSATPSIENLAIHFDPCEWEDTEIELDGDSFTVAGGNLAYWGRLQISGGSEIEGFDDLTIQGWGYENYKLHGEPLIAKFIFDDYEVDSIVFSQLLQAWKIGGADGYFAFRGGAIEAVPRFTWTVTSPWFNAGKSYQWTLIDRTQGIHADAWYWIGHAQADDFIGSTIAAIPELSDHPGSMLANAYKRDDFPGESLIQGYRFDNYLGTVLPALEKLDDFFGMTVVAIGHSTDSPGSLVVFGANRNNEIEIQTIDADTVAELENLGFVFPPEAP
jgi:hypothetical protein